MTENTAATGKMDAIRILKILSKWRKQLLLVAIGSFVISFIFTLPVFMTPMFKSEAVVYPVNIKPYSNESPTEQLVQIFNADDVRDSLVKAFNLYKHYDIDPKGKFPRFEMMKRLGENINVEKNEYESVDITVYDSDPVLAARICDSLIVFTDRKAEQLLRTQAGELASAWKMQMEVYHAEMDSMENAIKILREQYGITDFERQIEGFSREYYRVLASGNVNNNMITMRKNLEEKGGEYVSLREHLWRIRGAYNDSKLKYNEAMMDVNKEVSFHNLVTPPAIPERKDSPKRTLIMLGFMISCLLFASVVILYQENYRSLLDKELGS